MVSVEIKHVDLSELTVRATVRQAGAERERRAKVIYAEGELRASKKLTQAARMFDRQSGAMQLRYMQTLGAIASDKSSTIVFPMSIEPFDGKYANAAPRNEEATGENKERWKRAVCDGNTIKPRHGDMRARGQDGYAVAIHSRGAPSCCDVHSCY